MPIAKVGDINIEYYVEGSGPPLLMIMGFLGHAGFWGEPFLERLRPHFQVIRFSNRGTGHTDKPEGDVTIRVMADDGAGLLRELGIQRAHVLGISMGGMIAQELVLNHPQVVEGLVLGCTMCGFAHGLPPRVDVMAGSAEEGALAPQDRIRQFLLSAATPEFLEKADKEFWAWVIATWLAAPTPWETLGRHFMAVQSFDTYERLARIQAPALIVHGDRDQLIPVENAEVLRNRIEGSKVQIVSDVGHMFFWEKPAESAAAIVEYLSSVRAPA
jgi:pimeloyl-ACP methyl ester carboxylesterase